MGKTEDSLRARRCHWSMVLSICFFIILTQVSCLSLQARKKELKSFRASLASVPADKKMSKIKTYETLYPVSLIKDELLFQRCQLLLENGDYQEAIGYLQRLIKNYPESARLFEAAYTLAVCYHKLDQFDDSRVTLEKMLRDINALERQLKRKKLTEWKAKLALKRQLTEVTKPAFIIPVRVLYAELLLGEQSYQDALIQYRILARIVPGTKLDTLAFRYALNNQQAVCQYALLEIEKAIVLLENNISLERDLVTDSGAKVDSSKLLISIFRHMGRHYEAQILALNALQLPLSQPERDELTQAVQSMIEQEMDESELRAVIEMYQTKYPANLAAFRLVHLLDEEQRYREALEFIELNSAWIDNEEERTKLQDLFGKLTIKVNVNPRKIGFMGPLSGLYAPLGLEIVRGVRLAVDEHNADAAHMSQRIELVEVDTGPESTEIPESIDYLVRSEQIIALIGPVLSRAVEVALERINEYQIVAITPATSEEKLPGLSPYLFRNSITAKQQVEALVDYVMEHNGFRRFGVLFPDTRIGNELNNQFQEYVYQRGGLILGVASYSDDTTDFEAAINKIRGRYLEALFIPDYSTRVAEIAPQLAYHDVTALHIVGTNLLHSQDLIEVGGRYVEHILFTDNFFIETESILERDFIERFQESFGLKPTRYAAQAYDAAVMLLTQIDAGVTNREALRQGLSQISQFRGITGTLSFDEQGEINRQLHILTVDHGSFIQLQ
ncbi:penicillin-binding protein activator [bacterium]|nr:penicillin-binding protein activator [bacterium]